MAFEAYQAGDLPAMTSYLAPDVEWKQFEDAEAVHGPDGVLQALGRWAEDWDDLEATLEELVDAGDQVVLAVRFRGRGRGSGVTVEQVTYAVQTVRDGRITRMYEHGPGEREAALRAAGVAAG